MNLYSFPSNMWTNDCEWYRLEKRNNTVVFSKQNIALRYCPSVKLKGYYHFSNGVILSSSWIEGVATIEPLGTATNQGMKRGSRRMVQQQLIIRINQQTIQGLKRSLASSHMNAMRSQCAVRQSYNASCFVPVLVGLHNFSSVSL